VYDDIKIEYIDIEIRSKILRKVLTYILNYSKIFERKRDRLRYAKLFFKKISLPKTTPDLIISTGGDSANLNVWFAKAYQAKNIFNGRLRGQKERLYTIVTTVIPLGYKNELILDVAPSIISQKELQSKAKLFAKENGLKNRYYALLIGGDGAGYRYDKKFYKKLIDFVKKISKEDDIHWLITTSRRTPLEFEEMIKNGTKECCDYFVEYNKNPQKIMIPFLGTADKIFVTEESSSMISEAISSNKPVITLFSNKTSDVNYNKILEKFENNKKIKRVSLNDTKKLNLDFKISPKEYDLQLAQKIKDRLERAKDES
jgi:hypothetical protein